MRGSGRDWHVERLTETGKDFVCETIAGLGVQIPGSFHSGSLE